MNYGDVLNFLFIEHLKLTGAFVVGFLGSAAYVTALYFKFIGETEENRRIILRPFLSQKDGKVEFFKSVLKSSWYCSMGGIIAIIFQLDVPNFVAIQNLILGVTWPAIVSQFLSGRMAAPSQKESDESRKIGDLEKRSRGLQLNQQWQDVKKEVQTKEKPKNK